MLNKSKKIFWAKINLYFLFVALAFGLSAYFLLLDNSGGYITKTNILISPQNAKTAIYLDKIKENLVAVARKNNFLEAGVKLETDKKTNLIEVQAGGNTRAQATILAEDSAKKISSLASKHYDVKNDLTLEIVSREAQSRSQNSILILLSSILIGLLAAFLVQIILDWMEKLSLFLIDKKMNKRKESVQAERYLGNFFEMNREKIQKLSSSFPLKNRDSKIVKEEEIIKSNLEKKIVPEQKFESAETFPVNFKKAAFPANLPIAQDDLEKIIQDHKEDIPNEKEILGDLGIFPISETKEIQASADSLKEALGEPTEEDFKKRLNQLLGNRL